MPDALIGLDVGTSGVKGIAISGDGEILAVAEESLPALDAAARLVGAGAGGLVARLAGGARAAARRPGRLLRADARPRRARRRPTRVLRPAILWNDQRTAAECAEIEERVGLDRLIELTGNRALTGFTAPKLLWLRRHEPDVYARIRHVLLPKDYVRFRLTGERAIDVADASGTLLFDVAHRRWSEEVCAALEIPLEWLPPAYESTAIGGRRRPGGRRARRRHRLARPGLGRPRHLGRRLRRPPRLRAGRRRRACTSSATRCRTPGTRWA